MRLIAPSLAAALTLFLCHPVSADTPEQSVDAHKPGKVTWAQITIKGAYPEGSQISGLFGDKTENLADGIARLDKAAADRNISGVVLHLNSPAIGWAKMNEFRAAVKRVQNQGKKVYAWLDSGTSMDYLIASGCDKVIMPESGALMFVGLRAEVSFYKNLFDKLNLKADMLRIGEFKSAAEPYTRTEMSPAFREEMEAILDDYFRQMVDAVTTGRHLDRKAVIQAIDNGPHTATKAKKLGFIDQLAYQDELDEIIGSDTARLEVAITKGYGKKKLNTDFSGLTGFINLMNLMMGVQPTQRRSSTPKIAVIHATGMIMKGRSSTDLFGSTTLGSDTLVKAIQKAGSDSKVKAVVLRVDSPGGSALASDLMWRALEKVDKPVVVSMGDVAASGGYYISMGADYIYAEPGTLTGSIGVVGGKIALKGLYEKLGISTNVISRGNNSGTLSALNEFSDSERKAMMRMMSEIYDQFTQKAARGRNMKHAELEKLARGRVYTGAMAKTIGLVDELGTLEDAVAHAKKLAGLKPDEKIDRMILPKPTSPFERFFGPMNANAHASSVPPNALFQSLAAFSPDLAEHLKVAYLVNLLAREPRLTLMPFRLIVK